jgi:hypothetical protein
VTFFDFPAILPSTELREVALRNIVLAMLAVCLLTFAGDRARAEYTVIEVNFILADKDGNFLLSKTEYLLVALEDFKKLDQDGNNELDADEVGELSADPEFLDGDTDKTGSLSLEEVITEKLADFDSADTNRDGALNVDEVTTYEN